MIFLLRLLKRLKRDRNSHSRFDIGLLKPIKLNCGAERFHYSMFNVGRSMFDVHLEKKPLRSRCILRMNSKQAIANGVFAPVAAF